MTDDLGYAAGLAPEVRRVVSLVPSITEALAATCPERLVGATDWCTHPADLAVQRVRGTKNPDRRAIEALRPDLVMANKEENRELDVRRLRESGIPVWVTDIESVPGALTSLGRLFTEALDVEVPGWLREAAAEWGGPVPDPTLRVAVAIWRDPWMVVGSSTFTGDVVARLGWRNVFAEHAGRYPAVPLDELDRDDIDVVLLPDEPYVFTADDGPEAFHRTRTALVSGRLLTWYGPSLVGARRALTDAVTA
ncbi:ABC transporter substrate-binding protein [Intrasporangium oryzae NRRL B-24470]|uniref:ABC transporter substrate-binding protein n=1 Tax=Intrasporangium oryzae NRRL B-24470 TaxID=1386089 RepID=W9GD35_9MICO|nr:helical backbone metal receptor [Intrasporangium oryzae]EWT02738.1 ABC transporter substrate-binding protein [Intrasporangium oryzae NRRL B-24470]